MYRKQQEFFMQDFSKLLRQSPETVGAGRLAPRAFSILMQPKRRHLRAERIRTP